MVAISAGSYHGVFKGDGTVWATGKNNVNLGSTNIDRSNPVEVKNSDGTGFTGVVGITRSYHLV